MIVKRLYHLRLTQFLIRNTFLAEFYYSFLYWLNFRKNNPLFNTVPDIFSKTGIVYLLAPGYSNIGDIAIFIQSIDFIKANSNLPIKAILYSKQCANFKLLKRLIKRTDVLCIPGGGNMGYLYRTEELLRQRIIRRFKNNKIISFPQTIYFDMTERYFLKRSKSHYSHTKNLSLLARDVPSYDFALKNLTKNTFLVPDIVLSKTPKRIIEYSENGKVLLCLRHDSENAFTAKTEKQIEQIICQLGFSFEYFDTDDLSGRNIVDKEKVVKDTLSYFQKFQIVITNRFHGTVFSYITKTPCIAFDNSYGKVSACFEWYKKCNYMYFAHSVNEIPEAIKKVCNVGINKEYNLTGGGELEAEFNILKKLLCN